MAAPPTPGEANLLIGLVIGMFNATPGQFYGVDVLAVCRANGGSIANTAQTLSTTAIYQSLYPQTMTPNEFATKWLTTFGLQNDPAAIQFVTSRLNAGMPKWQVQLEGLQFLLATTDPAYAAAKATLLNKVDVSYYYTIVKELSSTSLSTLMGAIASVNHTPESAETAKRSFDTGTTAHSADADQVTLVGVQENDWGNA